MNTCNRSLLFPCTYGLDLKSLQGRPVKEVRGKNSRERGLSLQTVRNITSATTASKVDRSCEIFVLRIDVTQIMGKGQDERINFICRFFCKNITVTTGNLKTKRGSHNKLNVPLLSNKDRIRTLKVGSGRHWSFRVRLKDPSPHLVVKSVCPK